MAAPPGFAPTGQISPNFGTCPITFFLSDQPFLVTSKTHNLIDIRTRPRHPDSNGIVERFNGTVRQESDDDYGNNDLQAEASIGKLIHHYIEERLHAALGYMTPATWHRGKQDEVRDERARRIAAAHMHRKLINQQRLGNDGTSTTW